MYTYSGHDANDKALANATSALHWAGSSPLAHDDVVLDDVSPHCVKQLVPDRQAGAGK
jgi:hypothetical protein